MARAGTSAAVRLKRLEASLDKARALPIGEGISFDPMMSLLGISRPALRDWCNEIPGFEESGCFLRGGLGMEWTFEPRATILFLIRHFEAEKAALVDRNAGIRKAVGVSLPATENAASLEETKGLIGMTLQIVEASERMGRYTPTEDVAEFIEGYNQAAIAGIMGVRTKVDPTGKLPPDLRLKVDNYLRGVAASTHASAEKFVRKCRARLQQSGVGRAG